MRSVNFQPSPVRWSTEGASTMTTPSGPGRGRPDPGLNAVMSERRQLINLTYRLLGALRICAMDLMHAVVDTTVIALWLWHTNIRSTQP
jgi:hypothetical protein